MNVERRICLQILSSPSLCKTWTYKGEKMERYKYVTISLCGAYDDATIYIWPDLDTAAKQKQFIDETGCSGLCRGKHHVCRINNKLISKFILTATLIVSIVQLAVTIYLMMA